MTKSCSRTGDWFANSIAVVGRQAADFEWRRRGFRFGVMSNHRRHTPASYRINRWPVMVRLCHHQQQQQQQRRRRRRRCAC